MEICRSMSLFYVVAMVTAAILDFKTSYENTFCNKTVRNFFEWMVSIYSERYYLCHYRAIFWNFCIVSVLFYAKVGFGGKTPNYICEMAVIKKRKQKSKNRLCTDVELIKLQLCAKNGELWAYQWITNCVFVSQNTVLRKSHLKIYM